MTNRPAYQEIHYGDCAHRPGMYSILVPGKRGRLFSVLYTAAGEGPHPTVLLLHGIPGCERNFDLAQVLRRGGFHVMTFHYSGSWGSDGDYSLANDLEDAHTVLDFILQSESYGIDKSRVYAVGHSLGGFVCGQLTAARPEIRAAVLLMPCDIGRMPKIAQEDPVAFRAIRKELEESGGWLCGTSGEALWQEARAHSNDYCLESAARALAHKPVLCVGGTLDTCTPPAMHCEPLARAVKAAGGTAFQMRYFTTDHIFSDYRLTVADEVAAFLQEEAAKTEE